jgi:hypothetical protein
MHGNGLLNCAVMNLQFLIITSCGLKHMKTSRCLSSSLNLLLLEMLLVFLQPSVYYLWQGGSSDSVSDLYSEGAWLESWPEHPAIMTVRFRWFSSFLTGRCQKRSSN